MDDKPKKPVAKATKQPSVAMRRPNASFYKSALIVICAFAAAFLGSWAALENGWIAANSNNSKTQQTVVEQEGDLIANVAKNVSPSVVSITSKGTATSDFFGQNQSSESAGTGIIISKDGYILTNKHVIPDGTSKVEIVTSDGTKYDDVRLVGRDPSNDIAFLKINGAKNLRAATLGNSDQAKVGQKVVAIGNALGQFQNTVTQGIISGKGRPLQAQDDSSSAGAESLTNLFQTDAAINPGNSGGPMVNMKGEVIGMNTAVAENAQGIGFAIPINDAKSVVDSVLQKGKVVRPFLGVQYVPLNASVAKQLNASTDHGALVYAGSGDAVVSGGPADKAGIKGGDVITKVNGKDITDSNSLSSLLGSFKPGDKVSLTIYRDGKSSDVSVTLGTYPDNQNPQS